MNNNVTTVKTTFGGRDLIIETGKLAKQAAGSVIVRYGDSVVLVTVGVKAEESANKSFLPLSVDYVEKTFAAGKIPGGFFKREGRPTEMATLTSRFIDRPIRPLFPDGYFHETQVIATVLSVDPENDTDVMAMIGASAALSISEAPFLGPIAGVRVGRINGELVINPTPEQDEIADIDLIIAGTKDAVVMVESGAENVSEADMIEAIMKGHEAIQPVIKIQEELAAKVGKAKMQVTAPVRDEEVFSKIEAALGDRLAKAVTIPTKHERYAALDQLKTEIVSEIVGDADDEELKAKVKEAYGDLKKDYVRKMIVNDNKRVDGRGLTDVRQIEAEVGLLPRTHGSSLFTRGETQALAVVTLGTKEDRQRMDNLEGEVTKSFMLHYNFPPFCVGEVKFLRSPGRREIGHGALAERAIRSVLPSKEDFHYTIRAVSEVLESNGSSSMATVCGTSMALMDAGVPLKAPVAGVAMGLIEEDGKTAILTDILGDEDHLGDMDFKVTGTSEGITALQMDIKITGVTAELLTDALGQAREARLHILNEMAKTLESARPEISPIAPQLTMLKIASDKIGGLIGPGGKNIRGITETTGAKVDVEDDGTVIVAAADAMARDAALKMVKGFTASPEVGKFYRGTVRRILDFGAFVEIIPGTDGLCHISELENKRVEKVEDVLKEGEEVVVKVVEIDAKTKKIRLSRKQALDYDGEVEDYAS